MIRETLRRKLEQSIEKQIDTINKSTALTDKERIEFVTRMLPYCLAKIATQKIEDEEQHHDVLKAI